MPKFPEPPSPTTLAAIGLQSFTLSKSTEIWRIYNQGGNHPTTWDQFRAYGPTNARFDHHLPPPRVQERRILYAAKDGPTCIAEVFQGNRVINRVNNGPALVGLAITRDLLLLDLTSTWPTRVGASMAINSGTRRRAQRWAQTIYAAFPGLDGIYYPSSMYKNMPSVALFEGAENAIPHRPFFHRRLDDPSLLNVLKNTAKQLGYLLT